MKIKLLIFLPFLYLLFVSIPAYSQSMNSKDLTIAIQAEIGKDPYPFITLKWINSGYPKNFQIFKKLRTDAYFGSSPVIQLDSGVTQWTDFNVEAGKTYEYGILGYGSKFIRIDSVTTETRVFTATGYTLAGIDIIPELSPGACLLLIDSVMTDLIVEDIAVFTQDLQAEGWEVIWKTAPRAETFDIAKVRATKKIIQDTYKEHKNLKSIVLLGRIPVPYSGNLAPDGHGDHVGAWPADVYYGTLDDLIWSDMSINNSSASRQENKNIPGDGKFDVTTLGSLTTVNFAVGRIDMYNMPFFFDSTKANPEAELIKKYLQRDHLFRTNQLEAEWKGLVDDNFGAQGYPEAFAASGWRAFTNFFPYDSVKTLDYMTTLKTNTYLWSYGCGGGWYTSAGGIGNSSDFKTNKNNGLFTMLFGSYFGDWDYQNAFLRSALASDPGALTIGWSGRPHWFLHHMNLAEPIGTSLLATQNNNNVYYPNIYFSQQYPNGVLYTTGTRQIHIALLGDPTLKMFNNSVGSPRDLQLTQYQNNNVKLTWKEPVESGNYLYAVYRVLSTGSVTLLTTKPVSQTQFTDELTSLGKRTYFVKALKLGTSRSGSFYYSSNPITAEIDVVGVDEELFASFNLYPNPATAKLQIDFTASSSESIIEITDLRGNLVNQFIFESNTNNQNHLIWNLTYENGTRVPAGVYFVKLSSGEKVKVEKVIIH